MRAGDAGLRDAPRRDSFWDVQGRAVLIFLTAWTLFPGTALGATLNSSGQQITYAAGAGEANGLTVSRDGPDYVFTDAAGVTITPMGTCANAGANVGRCPAADVVRMSVTLGDLNDAGTIADSITSPQIDDVVLAGNAGSDVVTGGANVVNSLRGDEGAGAPGEDVITAGNLDDFLSGNEGNDVLAGLDGDDRLVPGAGNDVADAGPGQDLFSIFEDLDGADTFIGGPGGNDRADIRDRLAGLLIDLNGLADDGAGCPGPACEGDDFRPDIEDIDSGQGNDVFIGAPGPQDFSGEAGNDVIDGGDGEDDLFGDTGDDVVTGGRGGDLLGGGSGADSVDGGGGDDYLDGSEFFDQSADVLGGGAGIDKLGDGGELAVALRIDLDGDPDDGINDPSFSNPLDNVLANLEGLEGGGGDDVLIGNGKANEFEGGPGRDRMVGGGGGDALAGGRGGDNLKGGKGRDLLEGEAGADKLRSRDGGPDEVSCGSSRDKVVADRADRTAADCDLVRRSGGGK